MHDPTRFDYSNYYLRSDLKFSSPNQTISNFTNQHVIIEFCMMKSNISYLSNFASLFTAVSVNLLFYPSRYVHYCLFQVFNLDKIRV